MEFELNLDLDPNKAVSVVSDSRQFWLESLQLANSTYNETSSQSYLTKRLCLLQKETNKFTIWYNTKGMVSFGRWPSNGAIWMRTPP